MDFLKSVFSNWAVEASLLSEGSVLKVTIETLKWSLVFVLFDFSAYTSGGSNPAISGIVDIVDFEICYFKLAKAIGSWFSILDVLVVQLDLSWDSADFVIKSEDVLED